ncbi:MAG TPA: hypothetical protein VLE53_16790 [Gemmatimonadaceae bacterium]|nr:hypothetical protein [Gemmatimonadaceae bacterium]
MLRRLFPESLFARRLDDDAERRLRLAQARAEERIIDAHVTNALMFIDTLAEDLSFDRAIDTYVRVMSIAEPLASAVATRTLVVLGQELVPTRVRRPVDASPEEPSAPDPRPPDEPRVWLRDVADTSQGGTATGEPGDRGPAPE